MKLRFYFYNNQPRKSVTLYAIGSAEYPTVASPLSYTIQGELIKAKETINLCISKWLTDNNFPDDCFRLVVISDVVCLSSEIDLIFDDDNIRSYFLLENHRDSSESFVEVDYSSLI